MESQPRALLAVVLAIVVVAGVGSAFFLTSPHVPLTILLPAGVRLPVVGTTVVITSFTVPQNGTLIGAWSADTVACVRVALVHFSMIVIAPVSSTCGPYQVFNDAIRAGPYTIAFSAAGANRGPPDPNSSATVTVLETIQVVYG